MIKLAARESKLSRAQVLEVMQHIPIEYTVEWMKTFGDKDKKTSLRSLDKSSDFFTRELDEYLLERKCDAVIHSAKDLPFPLREGIVLVALTKGIDSSDALVFRERDHLETLRTGAVIATSSARREEAVKELRDDFRFTDIRGTIEERLEQLYMGKVDGVVIAEAALIRLGLNPTRVRLPGETAALQGKLAVVAREHDEEVAKIFESIDSRITG